MSRRRSNDGASTSEEPRVRQTILGPGHPRLAGVQLHSEQQREIWGRLCDMNHTPCRYAHRPTMRELGIEEDVMHMARTVGFHRVLTGEWQAYRKMTLEFLATLKVVRHQNGTPQSISFCLGGQRHTVTTEMLDQIFLCRRGGGFLAEVGVDPRQLWTRLAWMNVERRNRRMYNAQNSQAASIRNPAIRYFHRLLTCTVLARVAHAKVQSHEMTIIAAALSGRTLSVGCFLADHFERQQALTGTTRICCGGMITPIALYVGAQPAEPPVSNSIYLNRAAITSMEMIKRGAAILWIFQQKDGDRLFPLPNRDLTQIFTPPNGDQIVDNITMATPAHVAATIDDFTIPGRRTARAARAGNVGEDEEMAKEEAAYESGGDADPRYFHVNAPEFAEMQEFISDGRQEDRMYQEEQFGGIYTFMDEQRAANARFEERFAGYDRRFDQIDTFMEDQRAANARLEEHLVQQQQQHADYMEMMCRFGQHWGIEGPPPPPPPPY